MPEYCTLVLEYPFGPPTYRELETGTPESATT
jgi:hypothetical protein